MNSICRYILETLIKEFVTIKVRLDLETNHREEEHVDHSSSPRSSETTEERLKQTKELIKITKHTLFLQSGTDLPRSCVGISVRRACVNNKQQLGEEH